MFKVSETDNELAEWSWRISNARTVGFYTGKEMVMSEQTDNESESADETVELQARKAWLAWMKVSGNNYDNTEKQLLILMEDAFIDGYLQGFVKRFTGE